MPWHRYVMLGEGEVNPMIVVETGDVSTHVTFFNTHGHLDEDFWVGVRVYDDAGTLVAHVPKFRHVERNRIVNASFGDLLTEVERPFAGHAAFTFTEADRRAYPSRLQALMAYRGPQSLARIKADIAQRHRRWDILDRYYVPATEYLTDHGLDLWARYFHVYYARTELDRGRWDAAVSAIPSSVDVPGTPLARINALVVLGLVRARRGDPGYLRVLDEAGYLAERSGELQWAGPVAAARAEAAWLHDEGAAVAYQSDRALQACIDNRAGWWAGEIAWWRRCAGVDEPAPECAAAPWALLLDGRAKESAAAWRQLDCPYEEAVALSHSDDHDDLRAAFELLDTMGADPAAALVVRQMRNVGYVPSREERGPPPERIRPDSPRVSWMCCA